MPYWTTADALEAQLSLVAGVGRVYVEGRHLRDEARCASLMAVDPAVPGERSPWLAWFILRVGVEEEPLASDSTIARERWTLRCIASLEKREGAERDFHELLGRVHERFRGLVSVGDVDGCSAVSTPEVVNSAEVAGRRCLLAELEIETEERFTVGPLPVAAPVHTSSAAAARSGYGDAADQVAGYMLTVADVGHVWPERRIVTGQDDVVDLWTVEAEEDDGRRHVRAWQVWRDADAEDKGVALRAEVASSWRVQGAWAWQDGVGSGVRFQLHIDDVRERFRQVWAYGLGHVSNQTMVEGGLLQVESVDARLVGGVLCHFADCTLPIAEVAHA